jgi:hypothetical protein
MHVFFTQHTRIKTSKKWNDVIAEQLTIRSIYSNSMHLLLVMFFQIFFYGYECTCMCMCLSQSYQLMLSKGFWDEKIMLFVSQSQYD